MNNFNSLFLFMLKHFETKRTVELSNDIVEQIKSHAPREGLKHEIGNTLTQDIWVQFANQNYSAVLLDDKGLLQSYCVFGQDGSFHQTLCEGLGIIASESVLLMYIFTPQHIQHRGNARRLVQGVAQYHKEHNPHIKQLIWSTASEINKDIYINYGATIIDPLDRNPLKKLGIEDDYIFSYKI